MKTIDPFQHGIFRDYFLHGDTRPLFHLACFHAYASSVVLPLRLQGLIPGLWLAATRAGFPPARSHDIALSLLISIPIVNILVEPRVSEKVMIRRTGGTIWQHSRPQFLSIG